MTPVRHALSRLLPGSLPGLVLLAPLLAAWLDGCNGTTLQVGDSTPPEDADGDGFSGEDDCDDARADINPQADEVCDAVDNDCDGHVDEGLTEDVYVDGDGDGYGAGAAVQNCDGLAGYSAENGDCDDGNADVNPGAEEACNGLDDDCDGETDPTGTTWYADADGDGYGDDTTAHADCDPSSGDVALGGDCDDGDATLSPGVEDICEDGIDSDCDGRDAACAFEGTYDLGLSVDAKIYSDQWNYGAGEYLDVGDINDDGYGDIALTTFYAGSGNGGAYVIYGPFSGESTLDDAGDKLSSGRMTYAAGRSIAVGDIDGDGIDDVAVGAADESCKEFILFGPLGGDRELASPDVLRTGTRDTELGHGSDLADINGDGQMDLLVGAYEDDTTGYDAGALYVEFGPVEAGEARMDESSDLILQGESAADYAARYVHAGEDVDGDGVGDILAAAPYATGTAPSAGGLYLVYGGQSGTVSFGDADAKYVGTVPSEYAGEGLTMGDVDGDGLADVIAGSMANAGFSGAGAVYVVLGPATGVSRLDESDIVMTGDANQQLFGLGLSAKDMDGDGVGDLLVGARGDNQGGRSAGAAYLYWGPLVSGLAPSDANAIFLGEDSPDATGTATAQGDLDGDGDLDVILGAPFDGTGGSSAGAILVEYLGE